MIPCIPPGPLSHQTALVRFDYNVPHEGLRILDDTRLQASLKTLDKLLQSGAKVVILSHLGRPKGPSPELSLGFIAQALQRLLNQRVLFCSSLNRDDVQAVWQKNPGASVMLLENLRFWPQEEANDPAFAQMLGTLGDFYVNDAFSVSHRAHSSVDGITHYLPCYGGVHLLQEVQALEKALADPKRPLTVLLGGSKVSTKFKVLKHLAGLVDHLVLGGAMAHTFLEAKGYAMGQSLVEKDYVPLALDILTLAQNSECQVHLPVDVQGAVSLQETPVMIPVENFPDFLQAFDVGPQTLRAIDRVLELSSTVLWNGPFGVFEAPPYDQGSRHLAQSLARLTQQGKLFTVAGGGETVAVLQQAGVISDFSYVSTAGGAFLEFLEGNSLPGIQALMTPKQEGMPDAAPR